MHIFLGIYIDCWRNEFIVFEYVHIYELKILAIQFNLCAAALLCCNERSDNAGREENWNATRPDFSYLQQLSHDDERIAFSSAPTMIKKNPNLLDIFSTFSGWMQRNISLRESLNNHRILDIIWNSFISFSYLYFLFAPKTLLLFYYANVYLIQQICI